MGTSQGTSRLARHETAWPGGAVVLVLGLSAALGACTFSAPIVHSRGSEMGGDTGVTLGIGGQAGNTGCTLGIDCPIGGATGNPGYGGDTGCGLAFPCPGFGGTTGGGGTAGNTGCTIGIDCPISGATGGGGTAGNTGCGLDFPCPGVGGAGIGGQGGGGGATGSGCDQITSLAECDMRADCYSVYFDPGNCNCTFPGCCAQFHHCASGFTATCGGPVTCAVLPPHCESPYVISRRNGCFEGCVFYGDCSP